MSKIHQLAPTLSNQIAAGEVIERPASVVKELVENAIDAHATQIDITVVEAGIKLIQVIDNGQGIEPDDVPTAFLRHATSKIATVKDLFHVGSLGFRGEALASIAAIADVTLESATDNGQGTVARMQGGTLLDQHTAALPRGTQITVRDLFYNTPARLKYVKSQQTELSRVIDIVNRLALAHPEVAMTLRHDQNLLLKTAGHGDLHQTLAGIYGVSTAKNMLAFEGSDLDFTIKGYTSLPDTTRASRNYLSLMINGRYIKNYQLTKALLAGYGSKLMVGRFPIAVVAVTMDPLLVDVNVHPTKQEVRLSKEAQLSTLLTTVVQSRLQQENLIPDALHNLRRASVDMDQLTMDLNAASHQMPAPPPGPQRSPEPSATVEEAAAAFDGQPETAGDAVMTDFGKSLAALSTTPIFAEPERLAAWDAKYGPEAASDDEAAGGAATATAAPLTPDSPRFPNLRYLAQMHGTYLLAEGDDGFYILDQHAAQERVNYEHYRTAIGAVAPDQQRLLVPLTLDYPASDAVAIRSHQEVLASVGVQLEDFGQNSFVVRQHPTWFKAGQEEDTLKEMIDWVLADGQLTVAQFREKSAIMMACKRAIKANQHLDHKQAQALLRQLATAENPFNCPHGRPVLVQFTDTDLAKMFKRIQDSHVTGGVE